MHTQTQKVPGGAQKLSLTVSREVIACRIQTGNVQGQHTTLPPPAPGVCPPKSLQGTMTCWGALSSVGAGACSVDVREVRVIAGIDLEEEGGDL